MTAVGGGVIGVSILKAVEVVKIFLAVKGL